MAELVANPPRCPECGAPTTREAPPLPLWVRARRLCQAVALLALLGSLAYQVGARWPRLRNTHLHNPDIIAVDFPEVQITRADLEAMADPDNPAGDADRLLTLLKPFLAHPLGFDTELRAALIAPAGEMSQIVRQGWPRSFISTRYDGDFQDVYARAGATPQPLRGRSGWQADAYWEEWIDPTNGRATFLVAPRNALPGLLLVIAAWLLGRLIAAIVNTVCASRPAGPRRQRVTRWMPIAMAALALLAVAALSIPKSIDRSLKTPPLPWPRTAPTGLSKADLLAMRDSAGNDRAIARAILAAAAAVPSTGDTLAWGWHNPRPLLTGQFMGGWPRNAFDGHYQERALLQTDEPVRITWTPGLSGGYLRLTRTQSGPIERFERYTLSLAAITPPILVLIAAWIAAGLPARLAARHITRRARRRAARGDCIHCGYEAVRPTPPHTPQAPTPAP